MNGNEGFIRTVLGDVPSSQLGVCYAHEHIIIAPSFTTFQHPEFLLDSVDAVSSELKDFYRAGGRAMVDSMPCDSGRDVLKLAEVSRRSGVHIVCPTGLHLSKYYDPGHWSHGYGEEELASLFVADIEQGIDSRDYNGPLIRRTGHRAGVLKIATDKTLHPREERLFAAAAAAHRRTGCPILTHTEQGTLALEQAALLQKLGVDLAHVCLSHTDRNPDLSYHREILSTGVRVEFDSAFRWKEKNATLELLLALIGEFPDRILLGMDAARASYWRHYGGKPGLDYLLTSFTESMRQGGVTDEQWRRIFIANPAQTYRFIEPKP
jgi:phosphotriesterase-related protein